MNDAAPDTTADTDTVARLKQRCEELQSSNDGLLYDLEDVTIRADRQERRIGDLEQHIKYLQQVREFGEKRAAALELKLCCLRFEYEQKLVALEKRLKQ